MIVDRPLKLGELLAETVRLYGARLWAAAGIGAFLGGAVFAAGILGELVLVIAVIAPAFTVCYAVAVRIALGDPAGEAWAQVGLRAPVLAPLTIIVSLPFVLGIVDALILFFSVAWLSFVGLAIPVAMIERTPEGTSWFGQIGFALTRATDLARLEILHVHAARKPLAPDVDLGLIAAETAGFSGADLGMLCASAALAAVRRAVAEEPGAEKPGSRTITAADFAAALAEQQAGRPKPAPARVARDPWSAPA